MCESRLERINDRVDRHGVFVQFNHTHAHTDMYVCMYKYLFCKSYERKVNIFKKNRSANEFEYNTLCFYFILL